MVLLHHKDGDSDMRGWAGIPQKEKKIAAKPVQPVDRAFSGT
jgi:hypothetical protein